jgi:2-epi-5-epi-valiolone 7-kinase
LFEVSGIDKHNSAIVFDLGGTFFRSGIFDLKKGLVSTQKRPSINYKACAKTTIKKLQQETVDYLIVKANEYAQKTQIKAVSISLGAALNGRSGYVYGSAPLWGVEFSPCDLLALLRKKSPDFIWHIVNDVTASLIHYVSTITECNLRKVMLLTVSTGVAARTIDVRNNEIELDECGLQGEVGHLTAMIAHKESIINAYCDCGELNHLSSFSSGNGIINLVTVMAEKEKKLWEKSLLKKLQKKNIAFTQAFLAALDNGDMFSLLILNFSIKPIAEVIKSSLTQDPSIDRIVLVGGVVSSLSEHYYALLLKQLNTRGVYLSSRLDSDYFSKRLFIAKENEVNNLIGAGLSILDKKFERNYV